MDDGRIKQATTILQYKEQFLKALNPDDNPDFPPKLGDLAARLKAWRNTLQQAVDEAIDPILKLEDETRGLMVRVGLDRCHLISNQASDRIELALTPLQLP